MFKKAAYLRQLRNVERQVVALQPASEALNLASSLNKLIAAVRDAQIDARIAE